MSHPHYSEELDSFFPLTEAGSVNETIVNSETYVDQWQLSKTTNLSDLIFNNNIVVQIGQMSQHALQTDEVTSLTQMYQSVFVDLKVVNVSCLCYRFNRAKQGNKVLSSYLAKSDRFSYVCANLPDNDLGIDSLVSSGCRPGRVRYFFKHNITLEKENGDEMSVQSFPAFIEWYKPHPEINYLFLPITLWSPEFEPLSAASFMPVNRIACRCAQVQRHI